VLYTQPDFVAVESLLETHGRVQGFEVLLLPKFHCELNFIEQCWGYAKRKYREFPPSSKEANLERNLLAALEMVSLDKMRR
jgi:transposase